MIGTRRYTIKSEISFRGLGLHSAKPCFVRVRPARTGGIVFFSEGLRIPAALSHLRSAQYGLRLERDAARVAVVEHLLAALYAARITDALIEVDGPEAPILDGSALPFWSAVNSVGREALPGDFETIGVDEPLLFGDSERWVRIEPADRFEIDITVEFPHPAVGRQRWAGAIDPDSFSKELAPARTFGFLKDREAFHMAGLALGATIVNTLVFDEEGPLKPQTLRFPDEPVRHKALDIVGDFSLAGACIQGRVVSYKGGHPLNVGLLSRLMERHRRGVGHKR